MYAADAPANFKNVLLDILGFVKTISAIRLPPFTERFEV